MTDRDVSMQPQAGDDDWVDRLLVRDADAHREAYVDDDGFTARVMASLPAAAPAAVVPRWRRPVLTGMWAVAGIGLAYALPGAVHEVARQAFMLLSAKPFSLMEAGAVVAALALATYGGAALALRKD
jgi:hypothetical protein